MQAFRLMFLSTMGAALVASAVLAEPSSPPPPASQPGYNDQAQPAPPSSEPTVRHGRHAHARDRIRLPRELKIVWKQEMHVQKKSMPREKRHGWLREQWASMSDQQKKTKIAELQAKWDSLPASVQQALKQKAEAHRARHEAKRGERSEGVGE